MLSRVVFNEGVLAYELGRYEDAYSSFRFALELDPDDLAAKINLEYSLAKMDARPRSVAPATAEGAESSDRSGEIERILDYLRRNEEQIWRSTEEIRVDAGAPDW